jgi:hypothetical protein
MKSSIYIFWGNLLSKKGSMLLVTRQHDSERKSSSQSYRQEKSFQERNTALFSTGGEINNSIDVNKSAELTQVYIQDISFDLELDNGDNEK